MKHRLLFLIYLALIVCVSLLHSLSLLAFLLFSLLFILHVKKRSLKSLLKRLSLLSLFILIISLPYSLWSGFVDYTLFILLRVLNLFLIVHLLISTVNLFVVFSFSKTLSSMLVLAVSFSMTYRRTLEDFWQAIKSRSPEKPDRSELLNFLERLIGYFFERSLKDAEEVSMAMKSRGFYLD